MLHKNTIQANTLELLKKLQACNALETFHLAGGTSLALLLGHRKSIDLDLFTQNDFDTNHLLEYLEQNFDFKLDYSAVNTQDWPEMILEKKLQLSKVKNKIAKQVNIFSRKI